ncbi:MAG: histidine phosphatase family protein [Thermoplasmatota archaeon]
MASIYLVRHGQTVHNRDRILQGPRLDGPLSELGFRQAESLASALSRVGLAALYTSPMMRARETAQAVVQGHFANASAHPLPVQVVPELYEMDYGDLAGRPLDEIRDELEQLIDAWKIGFVDQKFPGGESPVLAQHRVRPFAQRVLDQARREPVLVVGHGRINRILMATWTGAGLGHLEEFPQSNASVSELAVGPHTVDVVRLNDTTHLSLATESPS